MAKETYYFSHDYNPIGDPKMQAMLSKYGGMGYGIFWRLVEMLHSETEHSLPLKKFVFIGVAEQMKSTPEFVADFVTDCIDNFELFLRKTKQNEGGSFFSSNRVFRNLENRSETKQRFVDSGRAGGIKSGESRRKIRETKGVEATLPKNEANEAKERKGKENIIQSRESITVDEVRPPITTEMTENNFLDFSKKMKADKVFTTPLFSQGVKPEHLDKWVLRYHIHIVGEGNIKKDYNEYRKHFKNWLNKQEYWNPPPELIGGNRAMQLANNNGNPAYIKPVKDIIGKYETKNGI